MLLEKPLVGTSPELKTLVSCALIAIGAFSIQISDDVARSEFASNTGTVATILSLLLVVWLYGVSLSLRGNRIGHVIISALSIVTLLISLGHLTGYDVSVSTIASKSGVFFVWVIIVDTVASLSSLLLAMTLLAKRWRI